MGEQEGSTLAVKNLRFSDIVVVKQPSLRLGDVVRTLRCFTPTVSLAVKRRYSELRSSSPCWL